MIKKSNLRDIIIMQPREKLTALENHHARLIVARRQNNIHIHKNVHGRIGSVSISRAIDMATRGELPLELFEPQEIVAAKMRGKKFKPFKKPSRVPIESIDLSDLENKLDRLFKR